MRKVIPFGKRAVAPNTPRDVKAKCAHRNLRLIEHGCIVMCADCHVTLSPFWALSMMSEQYALAMGHIHRLKSRIELADARILELSRELDAMSPGEKKPE
ncbi:MULTISPECIES: hypothetical protein [unclassified Caballeronia]|uniref:hypothetical protein n=1 Tax=unclassified Caballeronia TaxID=2646786 RepID=UPI0020283565|nr:MULTISPECIES: hypothetical protein [unclassified Caballeronia]